MSTLCRDCFWSAPDARKRCVRCNSARLLVHAELFALSIAHVDCDAFYASVEKRDQPELRDRPVIVGGGVRGVVTTACYLARTFGVRSAMPMFQARRLCPAAVVLPPDFRRYRRVSQQVFEILRQATPVVQTLSLDEAWLDLTGGVRLHGVPPAQTLARLQSRIESEIGVTVSVGLAANRFLAKIASDLDKPRGFAVIGRAEAREFLAPRPVDILPGVGPVFAEALKAQGLRTVGDVASADAATLERSFGDAGRRLAHFARGEDGRPVRGGAARRSISAESTFEIDLADLGVLERRLRPLCERVARQARATGQAGRVAVLKLRRPDFRIVTRRRTLGEPTQTAAALFAATRALLAAEADGRAWRLIGTGLTELEPLSQESGELFEGAESAARRAERLEDGLRERFGAAVVFKARRLAKAPGDVTVK